MQPPQPVVAGVMSVPGLQGRCNRACVSAGQSEPGFPPKQVPEQPHTANQLPAAGGGASAAPAGVVKPLSRGPRAPVPTPVRASRPPPALPAVPYNASVFCNRKQTISNILSRSRKPCPTASKTNTRGKTAGCPLERSGGPRGRGLAGKLIPAVHVCFQRCVHGCRQGHGGCRQGLRCWLVFCCLSSRFHFLCAGAASVSADDLRLSERSLPRPSTGRRTLTLSSPVRVGLMGWSLFPVCSRR